MTVQELIDELEKLDDKTKDICIPDTGCSYCQTEEGVVVTSVFLNRNGRYVPNPDYVRYTGIGFEPFDENNPRRILDESEYYCLVNHDY